MACRHVAALLLCVLPAVAPAATFRYERADNIIYVEKGGVATLSAIKAALPGAPLEQVDPARRIWLLSADLLVTNAAVLRLHGGVAGGDVDELRLKSDNVRGPGAFVSITADHGVLDLRSTRVTSWDTAAGEPDHEHEVHGRAFVRVRSRLRSMWLTPLTSRMDIVDSEIGFLGYNAAESYGLVWKVIAPQPYVFAHVRVYGNVLRSRIHDNYFGVYSSGIKGAEWRGNRVHHNVRYGFAPHTRSDDVRIEDNEVHDNGQHGITARRDCARMTIRNNRVWANGAAGITLHDGSDDGVIVGNRVYRNRDSGIVIHDSARATVRDNVVRNNGHVGVQLAMGTRDSRVERNDIGDNGFYGLFVGRGPGKPSAGDGEPRNNHIAWNTIHGSGAEDLRMGEAGLNQFVDNAVPARAAAPAAAVTAGTGRPFEPLPRPAPIASTAPAAPALASADGADEGSGLPPAPFALWGGWLALLAALFVSNGIGRP